MRSSPSCSVGQSCVLVLVTALFEEVVTDGLPVEQLPVDTNYLTQWSLFSIGVERRRTEIDLEGWESCLGESDFGANGVRSELEF